SSGGTAWSNTVTIDGTATLTNTNLFGGYVDSGGGDAFTNNTLNKGNDAGVISARNFQFINFTYSGNANIGTLYTTPTGSTQSGVTLNTNANNVIFGGIIDGTGNLIKTGAGVLTLNGANSYTGGTMLSDGRINVGNNSALGTALLSMQNGTTLGFNINADIANNITLLSGAGTFDTGANNAAILGLIDGAGNLTKTGAGDLTLTRDNAYTGNTTLSAGTLRLGAGGASGSVSGNIGTAASTTVAFNRSDDYTFSGNITGAGKVVQDGTGTLTLTGGVGNTFTGGTEIESGTLRIVDPDSLGLADQTTNSSGHITFTGGAGTKVASLGISSPAALTNSFRTQSGAGSGNYVDLTSSENLWITDVDIAGNGGAFYVAGVPVLDETEMTVYANYLGMALNTASGTLNDLYVESGGTFNLVTGVGAGFFSGIDGDGELNLSSSGPNSIVQFWNDSGISKTFHMGTTNVTGTWDHTMILDLARDDASTDPRVHFINTNAFNITGDGVFPSTYLMGDGIVESPLGSINVSGQAGLAPWVESLVSGNIIFTPGTLTLRSPSINLNNFGLLHLVSGPQSALSPLDAQGIPNSNNSLLNIESGVNAVNLSNGTVYFMTMDGTPFSPGDYLIIRSDDPVGISTSALTAIFVDGFDLSQVNTGVRGTYGFKLGGDPGPLGQHTAGTTNVWFGHTLNSLTMAWTGSGGTEVNPVEGTWTNGEFFYSHQVVGGNHERQFLTGDKVYIYGADSFSIELLDSVIIQNIASGLVVGKDTSSILGDDSYNGTYTISGAGGIKTDKDSAFGSELKLITPDDRELITGKLQKYGDSTLIFMNTGGNLFKDGIELYGGTIAFNQTNQLEVGVGSAIRFENDATLALSQLQSNAEVALDTPIDIDASATATFQVESSNTLRLTGPVDGTVTSKLDKTGAGTLTLAGSLNAGNYAGYIDIDAGKLVFNQSGNQILSGDVSGNGALVMEGANDWTTLTLTGTNPNFTGLLDIAKGIVELGAGSSLTTGMLAMGENTTFDYSASNYDFKNLRVYGKEASINPNGMGMVNFNNANLTFDLPAGMIPDSDPFPDVMLNINGGLDVDMTGIFVKVDNLLAGTVNMNTINDRIILVDAGGNNIITDPSLNGTSVGYRGISKVFYLITEPNQLLIGFMFNEQAKAVSYGRLAGLAFLNQADLIWGPGMYAAMLETRRKGDGAVPFFASSVGSLRYDTGSHVDVEGVHILTGFAWRAPMSAMKSLVTGVFFEAGRGSYSSFSSFNNVPSVTGKGNAYYYGAGVLGRYEAPFRDIGFYAEASLRGGYSNTDFSSGNITNSMTTYNSSAAYIGTHAGAGFVWKIDCRSSLDLSSKYILLHMFSDSVDIEGDSVDFFAVNSQRWRTGGRFSFMLNSILTPYGGAYLDYEFDGFTKANVNGDRIDVPKLRGGTGQGELGLIIRPSPDMSLSFDVGVQGYTGTREGVTGTIRIYYQF
ncbi:MAG: autotransporter-associated beta strand repeat-containing protein, partial [Syntrophorhabdaceae bacterium]|nr:autotransporter-associated beta strand repeat-containing protein [Syntrophorhabdaceae bacterium]